jgi:hypothetical protein
MQTESVTVWTAIWLKGVIGPYFFEDTVTGESYLSMLNEYFYSLFCNLPGKNSILFMHDDASPHYCLHVQDWLNQNFSKREIGRSGPID